MIGSGAVLGFGLFFLVVLLSALMGAALWLLVSFLWATIHGYESWQDRWSARRGGSVRSD